LKWGEKRATEIILEMANSQPSQDLSQMFMTLLAEAHKAQPPTAVLEIFLASFCKKGDELSQWRTYGADGFGYSIGISIRPDSTGNVAGGVHGALRSCVYEESEFETDIRNFVQQATSIFVRYYETYTPRDADSRDAMFGEILRTMFPYFVYEIVGCKHPSFAGEHEWRYCNFLTSDELDTECHFRATYGGIVPYVPMKLDLSDGTIQIENVYVGPRGDSKRRCANVQSLLKKCEIMNCEVIPSASPYRGK
jgi:hypothetical protein